jgi:hypothetical protein
MKITHDYFSPGIKIELCGDEVALAIQKLLAQRGVFISGPRTITVNGDLCDYGEVSIDPSGFVIINGVKLKSTVK